MIVDIFYKQTANAEHCLQFTYLAILLVPFPQFTEQNPQQTFSSISICYFVTTLELLSWEACVLLLKQR